jgi:hypothetical protein
MISVLMEIIKAERIPIDLVAPHHRGDADSHPHQIYDRVVFVLPEIAEQDLTIIEKHGSQVYRNAAILYPNSKLLDLHTGAAGLIKNKYDFDKLSVRF